MRFKSLCLVAVLSASLFAAAPALSKTRPRVEADAALLIDQNTGQVLYAKNAKAHLPIASLTKLMTALLVIEDEGSLNRMITAVPYQAQAAESQIGLDAGEALSSSDLLKALLLESANDAAVTLAYAVGGSERKFVKLMNARARQLELKDSHFKNPVGLDQPGHYSSALDLAHLAQHLMRNRFFKTTVALPKVRLKTGARQRMVVNRNELVRRFKFVKGIKTGHTAGAGFSLIGAGQRHKQKLISVVLGAPSESSRDNSSLALLEYGFQHFAATRALKRAQVYGKVKVRFRGDVDLVARENLYITVPRGGKFQLRTSAPKQVDQTTKGKPTGKATFIIKDQPDLSKSLVAEKSVTKAGVFNILFYWLTRPAVALVILLVLSLFLLRLRKVLTRTR